MNSRVKHDEDGLSPYQVAAEAGRCLYCYDAPCVKGCPAGVDVPAFIKKCASGNWRGALRVIREANVFGGTCARVCPTEELCEKECSSRLLGRAIPIGALQRLAWERGTAAERATAADQAANRAGGAERRTAAEPGTAAERGTAARDGSTGGAAPAPGPEAARRAAIVGSGPAGLSAAWELCSRGWDVTVYEATDKPGGQLSRTIPPYRLPSEVVTAEIETILAAGVKLRTGVTVGREEAERLLDENDAVILATGLGSGRRAGAEGEDRPGVVGAEEFLAAARREDGTGLSGADDAAGADGDLTGPDADLTGKRVVVVGGGNTAMDAAVTAARARAARVTVVYRRTAREMPAWPREYQGALAAGAEFVWLAQPVAFEGEDRVTGEGRVTAVRCVRMRLGAPDASGRAAPQAVPGSEFTVGADLVVMALGQGPDQDIIEAFDLAVDRAGRPVVDASGRASKTGPASKAGVFAAGDLANGGATVVQAVAEGKRAARAAAGELGQPSPRGETGSNDR